MVDWNKSLYLFAENLGDNIGERFNNLFYERRLDFDKRLLMVDNKTDLLLQKNIMLNSFYGYAEEIEYYSTFNVYSIQSALDFFGVECDSEDFISFYTLYSFFDDYTGDLKIVGNTIISDNYFFNSFIDFIIQKRIVNKIDYISSQLVNKLLSDFVSKCEDRVVKSL